MQGGWKKHELYDPVQYWMKKQKALRNNSVKCINQSGMSHQVLCTSPLHNRGETNTRAPDGSGFKRCIQCSSSLFVTHQGFLSAEFVWLGDALREKHAKCTLNALKKADFTSLHDVLFSADLATVSKCCFIFLFQFYVCNRWVPCLARGNVKGALIFLKTTFPSLFSKNYGILSHRGTPRWVYFDPPWL